MVFSEGFPKNDYPSPNENDLNSYQNIKNSLTARRLKKRAGLQFQATNDLRNHLRLDRKRGIVQVFHHTAFIKEQLRLTRDLGELSVNKAFSRGALPRQLALEVLDSI